MAEHLFICVSFEWLDKVFLVSSFTSLSSDHKGKYHFKRPVSKHKSTSDHHANEAACNLTTGGRFLSQDVDII